MVNIPERYSIIKGEDGHLDKSNEENRSDIDFSIATFLYAFMNSFSTELLVNRVIKALNYIDTFESDADKQKEYKVKVLKALNSVNESTMNLFNECHRITCNILSKEALDFTKLGSDIEVDNKEE